MYVLNMSCILSDINKVFLLQSVNIKTLCLKSFQGKTIFEEEKKLQTLIVTKLY